MPKIILKDGSEFIVDQDILDEKILSVKADSYDSLRLAIIIGMDTLLISFLSFPALKSIFTHKIFDYIYNFIQLFSIFFIFNSILYFGSLAKKYTFKSPLEFESTILTSGLKIFPKITRWYIYMIIPTSYPKISFKDAQGKSTIESYINSLFSKNKLHEFYYNFLIKLMFNFFNISIVLLVTYIFIHLILLYLENYLT